MKTYFPFLFFCWTIVCTAQYNKTYDYGLVLKDYLSTELIFTSISGELELLRYTSNNNSSDILHTHSLNQDGEIIQTKQFYFKNEELNYSYRLVHIQDLGSNIRLIVLFFYNADKGKDFFKVLKYNKIDGHLIEQFVSNEAINEYFSGGLSESNGFVFYSRTDDCIKRFEIKFSPIISSTSSIVSSDVFTGLNLGQIQESQVLKFNGTELSCFAYGNREIFQRNINGNILRHNIDGKASTGFSKILSFSSGNLLYLNGKSVFLLDKNFKVLNQKEVGLLRIKNACITKKGICLIGITTGSKTKIILMDELLNELNAYDYPIFLRNQIHVVSQGTQHYLFTLLQKDDLFYSNYIGQENITGPVYIDMFLEQPASNAPSQLRRKIKNQGITYNFGIGTSFLAMPIPTSISSEPSVSWNDSINGGFLVFTVATAKVNNQLCGFDWNYYTVESLPGPYTDSTNYSILIEDQFKSSFYVSKEMIINHLDAIRSGDIFYSMPYGIKRWPGNGNTLIGHSAQLAPYIDLNDNGIYEPHLGDYPRIYGDHTLFSITHENPNVYKNSGLEIHTYTYWFNDTTDVRLERTIFQKMYYISKVYNLDSLRIGIVADLDIGNSSDDYVGTNVDMGVGYFYNGDDFDETVGERRGFGKKSPVQGIILLEGAKVPNDGLDNWIGINENSCPNGSGFGDSIIDNERFGLAYSSLYFNYSTPIPSTKYVEDMNYRLQSKIVNGKKMRFGGSGYDQSDTLALTSRFCFPNQSDSLFYGTGGVKYPFNWSESNINVSGDKAIKGERKMVLSTEQQQLLVGDTATFDFAFTCYQDSSDFSPSTIERFLENCGGIRDAYRLGKKNGKGFQLSGKELSIRKNEELKFQLYPNPTNGLLTIQLNRPSDFKVTVLDAFGRIITSNQFENGFGQLDLSTSLPAVYFVEIQLNGQRIMKRMVKQ